MNIDLIVGHSNGGSIAIKAISKELILPEKLVLIGSAGIRGNNKGKNSLLKVATKTGKVVSSPLPKNFKSKLRSKLYTTVGSDMLLSENLQETFKNIVAEDLRSEAVKIDIPTLLIYGEEDKSTPPKFGMIYHEAIAGSTLELVGSAGHFVQFDQPEVVGKLIKDFIS
ncbi:MAG: alpha/beta hydrolase [bacterium]